MATELLMMSCVIDDLENRKVSILDIPGVFLQADMDDIVHIKIEGIMQTYS